MNQSILSRLKNGFKEAIFLNKMITPKVITACYWLILTAVAFGFNSNFHNVIVFASENDIEMNDFAVFVMALFMTMITLISVRVGFELLIILFKMHDSLQALRGDID
jgi:NADH:ubiquinone oxidoreductase subunit K